MNKMVNGVSSDSRRGISRTHGNKETHDDGPRRSRRPWFHQAALSPPECRALVHAAFREEEATMVVQVKDKDARNE